MDKNLKLKRRKHYYLEEGIVEELTHEGIDQLKIFLEDCVPLKGSILDSCKYELENGTYEYHGHDLARELVHILNKDQEFKNKVYQTDNEHDRPCQAAKYYDKVTGIGSFNILSKKFDSLIKEFESTQGEIDESTLDFKLKDILSDISLFINKGIKNKIHIKNSNQ